MAPVARTPGLREETARLTSWFSSLERQNHARELVQGLSLSEWDGIVTLSGDGLLFEVKGSTLTLSLGGLQETRTQAAGLPP